MIPEGAGERVLCASCGYVFQFIQAQPVTWPVDFDGHDLCLACAQAILGDDDALAAGGWLEDESEERPQ